jgi:hypothetical protein
MISLENYPLSVAPDSDQSRGQRAPGGPGGIAPPGHPTVHRVADAMGQFHMLTQPFQVSTMLG